MYANWQQDSHNYYASECVMLQESTFKINSNDDKEKLVVLCKIQHYIVTWEDACL